MLWSGKGLLMFDKKYANENYSWTQDDFEMLNMEIFCPSFDHMHKGMFGNEHNIFPFSCSSQVSKPLFSVFIFFQLQRQPRCVCETQMLPKQPFFGEM